MNNLIHTSIIVINDPTKVDVYFQSKVHVTPIFTFLYVRKNHFSILYYSYYESKKGECKVCIRRKEYLQRNIKRESTATQSNLY